MPKKTKKQKKEAAKRYGTIPPQERIFFQPKTKEAQESIVEKTETSEKTAPEKKQKTKTPEVYAFFKKDLFRSLAISTAIVLLIVGFYIAQEQGVSIVTSFQSS